MPSPDYINKSVPAIPTDPNRKNPSTIMVPIVSGGVIVNYLPVAAVDNGDGTATLKSTLQVINPNIDIGDVNVLNIAGSQINPSTEDTLLLVQAALDTIASKDFATQVTLLALKSLFDNADARISAGGVVSTANSSTTNLGSNGVFTGTFEETLKYSHLIVQVKASHASATNGLSIEWSADGITTIDSDSYSIPAGAAKVFTFGPQAKFFRLVYTNGAVAQTSFNLHVTLKTFSQKPSSHKIADSIIDEDDAELAKAVLTGITESGIFRNVKVSDDGFLKVVLPPPTAPSGSTSVQTIADSSMSGTVDTLYIIPNGATLKIQQLRSGSQRTTSGGTKVELYYDPAGTGIGMTLVDKLYTDGSSATSALDIEFVGNGTRAIRLRRVNFGGGSVEIFAAWRGYI